MLRGELRFSFSFLNRNKNMSYYEELHIILGDDYMLVMSVRYSSRCSFRGQVARCEVQVIDKILHTKRTFVGMTLEEAFNEFKKDNITYLQI